MSFFGRRSRQALEERLERRALGLKPARRYAKAGPRSRRPLEVSAAGRTLFSAEAFATCQHCGAIRIPNVEGKLPPHRCQELS